MHVISEKDFNDVLFTALDHAVDSIRDNTGPLVPFVLYRNRNGERTVERFAATDLEQGLVEAKKRITEIVADIDIYAVAWDGFITVDDRKWDAVLVEAGSCEKAQGLLIAQRYKPEGLFKKKRKPFGNPAQIGQPDSLIFVC